MEINKYCMILVFVVGIALEATLAHLLQDDQSGASTLQPLINAMEVFRAIELSKSRIEDMDVAAMLEIKSTYNLTRNWRGDPRVPQSFQWDGLNCSYDGANPARVISLNLSSYGLSGTIAPSISNLSALQMLDLSNNNLTGQVPEFLAELDSLDVLILKANSFDGPILERLLEKSKNGRFAVSIEDQMENHPNGATEKINMVIIPLVVSVATALLIISVTDLQNH